MKKQVFITSFFLLLEMDKEDKELEAELLEWRKSVTNKSSLQPWLEKYRPSSLNDVVSQSTVIKSLIQVTNGGTLPHLLFHGPPGSGKTSTILALARHLFKNDMKRNVLELNASMERGIDIIREKVKSFSKLAAKGYKLVILDEADSLTVEAQGALRRIMEIHIKTTRFCLICNYLTKILDPIISRTAHFRFLPLKVSDILTKLIEIVDKEKISIHPDALDKIGRDCNGDMRLAISSLYSAKKQFTETKIQVAHIQEITSKVPDSFVYDIWTKLLKTNKFVEVQGICKQVIQTGYPVLEFLSLLSSHIITFNDIKDEWRAQMCLEIASTEEKLLVGGDEEIQLLNLFLVISNIK